MDKIANDGTNINTEIFNEYFMYHNPSFLVKDLCNANKTRNDKIVNYIIIALIDLINAVVKKEIPENENPDKVANIVEKTFEFKKTAKIQTT